MMFILMCYMLALAVVAIFTMTAKISKWEKDSGMTFECGFTSSFVSRFSFSMHFFTVGLVFLFLDLELCFVMPFFYESFSSISLFFYCWFFIMLLLSSLIYEWKIGEFNWKF